MGANQSSTSNSHGAPPKKSKSQSARPPSFVRRTSLELPDLNKLSITPLSSRKSHSLAAADSHLVQTSRVTHRNAVEQNDMPTPLGKVSGAIESVEESPLRNDPTHSGHDGHVVSSIPLGIMMPAEAGSIQSNDDPERSEVPTTISWRGGGRNVVLAGTFIAGWRGRINMNPDTLNTELFTVDLALPPGTHRLKFIVDDQWRCADDLPTATDNDGHLVNYIEVSPAASTWDPSSESASLEASRNLNQYGDVIPPHLIHSALLEEQYLSNQSDIPPTVPHPALLPRHLEKVILNPTRHGSRSDRTVSEDPRRDDNSVLPIPNHVVLNHLGTSAIKHGVLAVATTMRYQQKYISTLYFKPVSA